MTLTNDFAQHLAARGQATRTIKGYCHAVDLFARWFADTNGTELDRTTLTQTDIREYRQHMIQRGLAPASINTKLAAVRSLAAWWGVAVEVASVEQQALAPRWLTPQQQAALLRQAERLTAAGTQAQRNRAARDLAIIRLLLNTGLRVSELCDLQPGDVVIKDRSGTLTVRSGKGSKRRTVALNREARAALAALALPIGLKPGRVQRAIAEVARLAQVPASPHTLRHTFAHNLVATTDPATLAALLGHANLNTTRRYTTPGAHDLQTAVDRLD